MSIEVEIVTASEDGKRNSGKQGYNYFSMPLLSACIGLIKKFKFRFPRH